MKAKLAMLSAATAILIVIIGGALAALSPANKNVSSKTVIADNTSVDQILQADILLHTKFQKILSLDAQLDSLNEDDPIALDIRDDIHSQEISFNEVLDSIGGVQKNSASNDKLKKLAAQFRQTFATRFSRRQPTLLRNRTNDEAAGSDGKLAQQVQEQQQLIAQLRAQVKRASANSSDAQNAEIKQLQERLDFVGWALKSQLKTLENYKIANKQLTDQVAELRKN